MEEKSYSADSVRALQDQAAAMAQAAVDEVAAANPSANMIPGGYSPLPQGPALTAETLVETIIRMARTFESREDMIPAHVAQVTALGMMQDSQGQRTGIQGVIGHARYEFAAWKPYERHPGHTIELTVRPSESCELSFKSLNDPLVAAGFNVTKSMPPFKPLVFFERAIPGGLGLYVVLSADDHKEPRCVSMVTLEMEPRDG
jgi:hypothetical protein